MGFVHGYHILVGLLKKPFGNPVEPAAIKTLTWPGASLIMTCHVVSERLLRVTIVTIGKS